MKYKIYFSTSFKKSYKLCKKRGYDMSLFDDVYNLLAKNGCLPEKYLPHQLHGKLKGIWECHISSDWILLWDQNDKELTLYLMDTGHMLTFIRNSKSHLRKRKDEDHSFKRDRKRLPEFRRGLRRGSGKELTLLR